MSNMSNIYTTAQVISELEDRMNELEELCVAVNEADDDYPCDCETCNELTTVYTMWKRHAKEWATFPPAIRIEAMELVKEMNA